MTAIHPLFARQEGFALRGLARLPLILDEVMPVTGAQRRDIPMACRDLSAMLTTERDSLSRPYWGSPRLTSAYLRYFLPWNLVRLTALLPGLDLGESGEDGIPAEPLILDLGSGPLTLPLALWLSRPDLRRKPVTIVCTDTAPHPLELGRRIFDAMRRDLDSSSPWIIRTLRAPAHAALRQVRGRPWMLTLGNVLNELEDKDRRRSGQRNMLQERLVEFLDDAASVLPDNGRMLAVEPGTRQGGRLISGLRHLALDPGAADYDEDFDDDKAQFRLTKPTAQGHTIQNEDCAPAEPSNFQPLSPCPHAGPCPMLTRGVTAWCHVNAPAENVPHSLRELSREAGLDKDSVSLSFLLLRRTPRQAAQTPARPDKRTPAGQTERLRARIASAPFVLPGWPGRARYACSEQGLLLIVDSAFLPNGCLCDVEPMPKRDAKSGARLATLPGRRPAEGNEAERSPAEKSGPRKSGETPRSHPLAAKTLPRGARPKTTFPPDKPGNTGKSSPRHDSRPRRKK